MYKTSQLALTDEDIASITKRRNLPLWIIGIACLVFDSMFLFVVGDSIDKILFAICVFDLMMAIPIVILYKRGKKDLDAGYKSFIQGEVDKKELKSTGKTTTPYLFFGGEKIIVSYSEYKSVQAGDKVEITFTAHTKYAISFRKL